MYRMMTASVVIRIFWRLWFATMILLVPVPHTIALRNLVLVLGIGMLLWFGRNSLHRVAPWLKSPAWWLAVLTAWIVVHSLVLADSAVLALDQVRANWLMPMLIGGISAWAACQLRQREVTQSITAAFVAHLLLLFAWQFKLWLSSGYWPFRSTPFGAYDFHGTINSFFLALLLADRVALITKGCSPLALDRGLGWALLPLPLICNVLLQSRNSSIVDLAMLAVAGLALARSGARRWHFRLLLIACVALIASSSLRLDDRWEGLRESLAAGWNSSGLEWMGLTSGDSSRWPVTRSGRKVEESAYLRSAWARNSVDMLSAHPMGVGFGHDAFGRAIMIEYGHIGLGSSHSGWLDFALGTGLFGLALLLAGAASLIRNGWRRFRKHGDGQALLLTFFVGGYLVRCLLDGHLSGWRLVLFALICGALVGRSQSVAGGN